MICSPGKSRRLRGTEIEPKEIAEGSPGGEGGGTDAGILPTTSSPVGCLDKTSTPAPIITKSSRTSVTNSVTGRGSRAELIEIDYDNPETLRRACDGVSKIFLLTPDSPRAVELASNLVREAKKAGVRYRRQGILIDWREDKQRLLTGIELYMFLY